MKDILKLLAYLVMLLGPSFVGWASNRNRINVPYERNETYGRTRHHNREN